MLHAEPITNHSWIIYLLGSTEDKQELFIRQERWKRLQTIVRIRIQHIMEGIGGSA